MTPEEISKLADEQLLEAAKNIKPAHFIDAFFIGFLAGIIIFGFVTNSLGFLAIIPLFLIYFFKKTKATRGNEKRIQKTNFEIKPFKCINCCFYDS